VSGVVELPVDVAWAVGLILGIIRVATFAVVSPIIGRAVPMPARVAFTFAVGLAVSQPVAGVVETGDLLAAGAINALVGGAMGYVSGLIFHLFASAGGMLDLVSGLAVSTIFDPMQGDQGGVFARMFHLTAITMFLVGGGMLLLVGGLVGSTRVLPLDAPLSPQPGLAGLVVELTSDLVRTGFELALPVMGVLFMLELALGLASRFAPQANVFLLGLPAKILASITVIGSSWVLFPDALAGAERTVARSIDAVLRGLGAGVGA
jgi:flagellar biosynthesis protein FliR